jgi:hypothetical protein
MNGAITKKRSSDAPKIREPPKMETSFSVFASVAPGSDDSEPVAGELLFIEREDQHTANKTHDAVKIA